MRSVLRSADDEGDAENEHAVGDDRADEGGLDDARQAVVECEERDEELRQIPKRGLDHTSDRGAQARAELFRRAPDEPRKYCDRERRRDEGDDGIRLGEVCHCGGGDEHERQSHLDDVAPGHRPIIEAMTGDELREVMRRFPAPVAVVTTELDGDRFGLTVGSLVSLSLEPPLVGISIGRASSSHEPIRQAPGWAASLLSGRQIEVARHFARSGIPPVAMWVGVDVRDGSRGPLVEGALGWLECRTVSEHEAGDHTIFVGEVESIELGAGGEGLVYRGGEYHPA